MNMPLRVAIVGLGAAGRRRMAAVRSLPALYELAAVCDIKGVEEHGNVPLFTDHRQMLAEGPTVDVVVVCTTNDVTCAVVKDALTAGKHVFCEKPAGRSLRETEDMAVVARAAPGRLVFGFNHRHHGSVRQALTIARSGDLGRLVFARGVYGKSTLSGWRAEPTVSGGGIFLDQGIHLLDLARAFCGEFTEVRAMAGAPVWSADADDNIFTLLRTATGAVASLHSSATQWRHVFQLELAFTQGALLLDGLVTGSRAYLAAGSAAETLTVRHGPDAGAPVTRYSFEEDDSWERELAAFADAIANEAPGDAGLSGIEDAVDVMRLVGTVYEAALVTAWPLAAERRVDAISSYRERLGRIMETAAWDR
jgi:predicted dehydrogenase